MSSCRIHPDREATSVCTSCGTDLCEECVAPGAAAALCFDCSITSTGESLAKEQAASLPHTPTAPRERRISSAMRAILAISLCVIAAELAMIVFLRPQPQVVVAPPELDQRLNANAATTAEIILISEGLEEHRRERGYYPEDLASIAEYLPEDLVSRLNEPTTAYSVDENGSYSIRFRGDGPNLVSIGPGKTSPRVDGVAP